jgi:hypothetical protein
VSRSSFETRPPGTLVMVRFGRTTLLDDKLRLNCEVTFARWAAKTLSSRMFDSHRQVEWVS